ncbi:MAG TPA: phosphoenolpyruvate carboxylase [Steroidobacteraceae bacterium]|nr:phosphoenolpyruvate carboxylase [Steroidobacteraceae bacterium]
MKRDDIQFPAKHSALRDDVHVLGALVGDVLKEQGGDALFELVEKDRRLSIGRRAGDKEAAAELSLQLRGRAPQVARDLARAFSAWFRAVNLAEKVHRIRRRRGYFLEASERAQPGGVEAALIALKARGLTLADVLELLQKIRIEPVFTAHPTESARRTMLRKNQRIAGLLLDRLDPTLTPAELRQNWNKVRTEITTAWQTEDHPRERLTVADEREHVVFYLAEILYQILPAFYDELAEALGKQYGVQPDSLELPGIVRFGTWVGGDMDGNPDVHAKTIRETLARQQQVIINAYFTECQNLAQLLSQSASRSTVTPELTQRIELYATLVPGAQGITPMRHDRMPYRVFFGQVSERLRLTYDARPNGYEGPQQFLRDLKLVAASLRSNRGFHAGWGNVQRLIRRVETFGFHLATLDLRQQAEIHHRVIGQGLDDPQWMARTPAERHDLLVQAIERDTGFKVELDALGKRTLGVFDAILQARHRFGRDAIGYYVVSGTQGADDVLAPLLLARWAEAYDRNSGEVAVDIAPLFESVDVLERCGEVMRTLLGDPLYRRHLEARGRTQCALVGYSDSNKESGILASRHAAYRAQAELSAALSAAHEQHVLFHARGGSIARGGGRVDSLVRTAPAGTVNGVLRLTEQGEAINQGYGLRPIAMRTLERAFNALMLSLGDVATGVTATPQQLQLAARAAAVSRQHYRRVVHDDADFYAWFQAVTPIDVIARMQIGSRPAVRPGKEGIDALRAVPWVFAWTQSRHMLPAWFGAGMGLKTAIEELGIAVARSAYGEWNFFSTLIDDLEASLARADLEIAAAYEALADSRLQGCGARLREEFELVRRQVLEIKQISALLDRDSTLQRAIELRNPYVDPINLLQVDLLRRWRESGRQDRELFEGLLACTAGIAEGLQSTG